MSDKLVNIGWALLVFTLFIVNISLVFHYKSQNNNVKSNTQIEKVETKKTKKVDNVELLGYNYLH